MNGKDQFLYNLYLLPDNENLLITRVVEGMSISESKQIAIELEEEGLIQCLGNACEITEKGRSYCETNLQS